MSHTPCCRIEDGTEDEVLLGWLHARNCRASPSNSSLQGLRVVSGPPLTGQCPYSRFALSSIWLGLRVALKVTLQLSVKITAEVRLRMDAGRGTWVATTREGGVVSFTPSLARQCCGTSIYILVGSSIPPYCLAIQP